LVTLQILEQLVVEARENRVQASGVDVDERVPCVVVIDFSDVFIMCHIGQNVLHDVVVVVKDHLEPNLGRVCLAVVQLRVL